MLCRVIIATAVLAVALPAFQVLAMHHEFPKGYRAWGT